MVGAPADKDSLDNQIKKNSPRRRRKKVRNLKHQSQDNGNFFFGNQLGFVIRDLKTPDRNNLLKLSNLYNSEVMTTLTLPPKQQPPRGDGSTLSMSKKRKVLRNMPGRNNHFQSVDATNASS